MVSSFKLRISLQQKTLFFQLSVVTKKPILNTEPVDHEARLMLLM